MKSYLNFEFDAQDAQETNEQRYERLLKEFRVKSQARFLILAKEEEQATSYQSRVSTLMRQDNTYKLNQLYNSINGCWNKTVYPHQEELLIQILARLNRACDEPNDLDNLQQLAVLREEIPNKEIHWHRAKYLLGSFLTVALTLAILIPLVSMPPLALIGITFLTMAITMPLGGFFTLGEMWKAGFKSHLQPVQKNINSIAFFAPEKPAEKETTTSLDDEMSGPIAACS